MGVAIGAGLREVSVRSGRPWSSRLGLKENATKEKYYHENPEVKAMRKTSWLEGVQAEDH